MSKRNPKGAGRKRKYDNPEEQTRLQKLVYLYREKHPSGMVKIANMVRFSAEMNRSAPSEFPMVYNKDVWGTWGRKFIEIANEPIKTEIESEIGTKHELPNFSDIIDKYFRNKQKLLESLLTCENFLHATLSENDKLTVKNNNLEELVKNLKIEILDLEETIKKYELMILEMAHHSGIEKYREKYGLKNQISVAVNRDAFNNMDNLHSFLETLPNKKKHNNASSKQGKDNVLLANWKNLRK